MWKRPAAYRGHGYHSKHAEKNSLTWAYAQLCCGKFFVFSMIPMGVVSLAVSIIGIINDFDEGTAGGVSLILCIIQSIILVSSILVVENRLIKHFDKEGNPK